MFKKETSFNATNSLAHTKWNCKYHIVFAPKYRRKVFYEDKRVEIRDILRQLCEWKGVEIIEGEICPDHIHMLLSIPPKMSISSFMGYLKGKSSLIIFQKYGNMKFAYRNREFWCKGYYVDTTGKDYFIYREKGFDIDGEGITVNVEGSVILSFLNVSALNVFSFSTVPSAYIFA